MDPRVTQLLDDARGGKEGAAEKLLREVYDQLRRIAQAKMNMERSGHTLQATALVHEAYLRLIGPDLSSAPIASRAQFFAAAGEAMRRILIEHARARNREKRGGGRAKVSLDAIGDVADLAAVGFGGSQGDDAPGDAQSDALVAFDDAFRRLEEHDAAVAQVVRLRFFVGLTVSETAEALGLSDRTVNNRWSYARAWLARELGRDDAATQA